MNSSLAQENTTCPSASGKEKAWLRWLPTLLIVGAALAYYGSYLRYWFNPHDEGGTVCLIAQRLMQGERPWADVALGYNVGWFYPLVALFKITGVNYLAARTFFFALSTLTALLGGGIVARLSGSRWVGLGVGLVLVALPGSQFKNYIPLAAVANTACLLHLLSVNFAARRKWFAAVALGGAVLGLTLLVRVEIAIFFAVIWTLLLLLVLLDKRLALVQRATHLLLGAALLATVVGAVQVPPYLYLRSLGVEAMFVEQVPAWLHGLRGGLSDQIGASENPVPAPAAAAENAPAQTRSPAPVIDRSTLRRHPLSGIWHPRTNAGLPGDRWDRILAFLTYAPLAGFGIFFLGGVFGCARRVLRGDFKLDEHSVKWLLLIGGSLSTFPQFFFFRPDRPHLSEFMPGYILAMAGCMVLCRSKTCSRPRILITTAFALGLLLHLAVFALYAFQHASAGTAAARTGRKTKFAAQNGVAVRVQKKEAASLTTVRDAILAHSRADDFLVCYPYMPGYNLMTNRRTYVHNVYVDNATHEPGWAAQTIRDFEEKKPAVIVIDNRAINGGAASRFSHWAAPVYDYVKIHYARVAEVKSDTEAIEVYAKSFAPIEP